MVLCQHWHHLLNQDPKNLTKIFLSLHCKLRTAYFFLKASNGNCCINDK